MDILLSKLQQPSVPRYYVPNVALLARIGTTRLTFITAPTGYGKSSAVADWCNHQSAIVLWVTCDVNDDDLLVDYLNIATANTDPNVVPLSGVSDVARGNHLLNWWVAMGAIVVVLDDFHQIIDQDAQNRLRQWIVHTPANVRWIFLSRSPSPPSFASLFARGWITELGIEDFRLTPQQITSAIHNISHQQLSFHDIAILDSRLEGWAVGWQLAALALREHGAEFVLKSFGGDHHSILLYLRTELLVGQTSEVVSFLQQTAILDYLVADLCQAVTNNSNSHKLLQQVYQDGLFVAVLDAEHHYYRYHALWREVLLRTLQDDDPKLIPQLHQRAAAWYSAHNMPQRALHHSVQATDFTTFRDIFCNIAPKWIANGEFSLALHWLEQVPLSMQQNDIALVLAQLRARYVQRNLSEFGTLLGEVEQLRMNASEPQLTELSIWEGCWHYVNGQYLSAIDTLVPLELHLPDDIFLWVMWCDALGTSFTIENQQAPAYRIFQIALDRLRSNTPVFLATLIFQGMAWFHRNSGQIGEEYALIKRAMSWASDNGTAESPWLKLLYGSGGMYHINRLELDLAEERFSVLLNAALQLELRSAVVTARCMLAAVQRLRGNFTAAYQLLDEAEAYLYGQNIPPLSGQPAIIRVNFWIEEGQVQRVATWLAQMGDQLSDPDLAHTHAHALILLRRPAEALAILQAFDTEGGAIEQVDRLVLMAVCLASMGEEDVALDTMQSAIAYALPEHVIWSFVQVGRAAADIIKLLKQRKLDFATSEFIGQILSHFPIDPAFEVLSNPLTNREQEVLYWLGQGLSSADIAAQLVISAGTARNHVKRIYRKLEVSNRVQAVERARTLGLI